MEKYHGNTVEYWKQNAEENYLTTPISVLKYITVLEEQAEQLRKHAVSGLLHSVDTLDDENSEIHKVVREIGEMSDEEFEDNSKAISEMLSRSKGNDR